MSIILHIQSISQN